MSRTSALGTPTFYMTEKFMLTKVKFFLDRNGDDTISDPSETSLEMDTSTEIKDVGLLNRIVTTLD